MALSAMVHGALMAAWIYVPAPDLHQLGIGAMTVQVVLEQPPPEPPAATPEPQPEPKPQPVTAPPKPVPPNPMPPVKPMKTAPAKPSPVAAPTAPAAESELPAAAPAAQPVMSDAPAPVAEGTAAAGATALGSPNARNVERDDYLRIVWSRIMRYRPARVPVAGTTRLRFTLDAGGELVTVEVAEGSGSATLDRAALDAVRRAAPFPPPPSSSAPVQHFEIPFQFRPAS